MRNLKIYLVSLNTTISNSIIKNGVSTYASKLSFINFCILIEESRTIQEALKVGRKMIRYYTSQITETIVQVDNMTIRQAINYINENLEEELTLTRVSEHLGINRCYFCTQFKECTNMSFTEYVSYRRIEESKYYLTHTDLSLLDIAITVGFNSQSYFATQFKKFNNLTPKEYRDKNRAKLKV